MSFTEGSGPTSLSAGTKQGSLIAGSTPAGQISADEQRRLDECVLEPIRTPGSIQPHGALLAVRALDLTVMQASENTGAILGTGARQLLGHSVSAVTGVGWLREFGDHPCGKKPPANPLAIVINNQRFDVISHVVDDLMILEFEPSIVAPDYQSAPAVYGAIQRLTKATTAEDLWMLAARELRELTQFDRVMIYHFHPDGHGEIVAEELADGMEPYFGLHYPASDIPVQARQLYLSKLSRLIVNSSGETSTLLRYAESPAADGTQTNGTQADLLDLSQAELRSVSPHHLQFMRNMGQASTLSLSLIHDGELIGMITLAHRSPHRVPFILRTGLEILANQVALQLSSMAQIRTLTTQMQIRSIRSRLIGQLASGNQSDSHDIADALFAGELSVLDLVAAGGASLRLGGTITSIGEVPGEQQINDLLKIVIARDDPRLVSASLTVDCPQIAGLVPEVAGLLVVPLGGDDDYLLWFRPEISQTVAWLGDQSESNRETPLSPRTSFSAWSQGVSGRSISWNGAEVEAEELSRDLASALLRRAEAKLASQALHDSLTGLPNRRLLMDRIEHALAGYARGTDVSLLFIDLDRFKEINDSNGHLVGDALLVHTAKQILATTRTHDTVARLGGDEFVVLCEDTTFEEANVVAGRIVDAIRQPAYVGGVALSVTASVGIAAANFTFSAADLLREADAAMYRAKSRGRDQTSR